MGLVFVCVYKCHCDGTVPHIALIGDANCNVTVLGVADVVPMIRAVLYERCQLHRNFIDGADVAGLGDGFAGVGSVIRLSAAAKDTGIYIFPILECGCCRTLI